MSYGNGLMHVGEAGRAYLHHTGGMLSFSSSFHVDIASGVGAFASSTIHAFAEYRPRLVTRFAVDALTNALAGKPLPSPPPLQAPLAGAASYIGRYVGPAGAFEVRSGKPLIIVANGETASLELVADEVFRTTHPLFHKASVMFERKGSGIVSASWGPNILFVKEGGRYPPQICSRPIGRTLHQRQSVVRPFAVIERSGNCGWVPRPDDENRRISGARARTTGRPSARPSPTLSTAATDVDLLRRTIPAPRRLRGWIRPVADRRLMSRAELLHPQQARLPYVFNVRRDAPAVPERIEQVRCDRRKIRPGPPLLRAGLIARMHCHRRHRRRLTPVPPSDWGDRCPPGHSSDSITMESPILISAVDLAAMFEPDDLGRSERAYQPSAWAALGPRDRA